ncbi:unnamed protein product [Vitrella brassicaformis CCMP3155]|uniref:Uncharacterized protein n=2 Tax=Vitrella brassicaformis TaxID=1169539 RepID=A0A0G4FTL9_VITBC|nr:unnamed protein product [Vitrella brassicaformis CCMP3155]|eukprot:CEM18286.1 unnamed protein product [Vitrella brassicaformis CCMP3155]
MALARASVALRGVRRPVAASASQSCVGWSDGGRRHYNKPFKSYWEYKPMDNRPLETWEEVEMNRPRNPSVNEGYARPTKAPTQFELTREQFHQFMRGTPKAFSPRLKGNLTAIGLVMFMAFEMAFTFYQMRPDDFEWVEDER